MKKKYLLCITNGLTYDDYGDKPLLVSSEFAKLDEWIKDHPITHELYKQVFKTRLELSYMSPEYFIEDIYDLDEKENQS